MSAPEKAQQIEIDLTGKIRQLHEEAARRATSRKGRRTGPTRTPAVSTAPPPATAAGVRPWHWAPRPGSRLGPELSPGERLRQAVGRAVAALESPGVMARTLARTGRYISPDDGRHQLGLYAWSPEIGCWKPDDGYPQLTADIMQHLDGRLAGLQRLAARMIPAELKARREAARKRAEKAGGNPDAAAAQVSVDDLRYEITAKLISTSKKITEKYITHTAVQLQVLTRSADFARYLLSPEPWETEIIIPVKNGNIVIDKANHIELVEFDPSNPDKAIKEMYKKISQLEAAIKNGELTEDQARARRAKLERDLRIIRHWALYRLPVRYDPAAPVPRDYLQMVEQWFAPRTAEMLPPWQQLHGLLLTRVTAAQDAVLLLGGGSNGKSAALAIMRALVGAHNTNSATLQQLTSDRFALVNLEGKLANICADLPTDRIKDTSLFKQLVGSDMLTVEKKYVQPRQTRLWARLVFSANNVPPSDDRSHGYFRRWVVFKFQNLFVDEEKYLEELRKRNASGANYNVYKKKKELEQTVINDETKMSGLLNWALEGLIRLRSHRWAFSGAPAMDAAKQEFRESSDLINKFLRELTDPDHTGAIPVSLMYRLFRVWWLLSGMKNPIGKHAFNRVLTNDGHTRGYRHWPTADGGRSVDCWHGMALRTDEVVAMIDEAARSYRRDVAEAVYEVTGWLAPVLRRPSKDELMDGWETDTKWDSGTGPPGTFRYYYPSTGEDGGDRF